MKSHLDIQQGGDHYKRFKIQPVEFCEALNLNSIESNVVKYTVRHPFKDKEKDIKKAIHNLCLRLEITYGIKSEVTYEDE